MLKTKKPLLRILKVSNIYGGLLSFITVTTYLSLVFLFPGTFRYLPIQAALLPPGIVLVTVFSYLHLSYYGKASDKVVCPISIGVITTLMCLSPGLIIIALFTIIPFLRYGDILPLLHPLFGIPFILGSIGIVLGILSIFATLRINKRKVPGELRLKLKRWKIKGLWLGIAILTLGVLIAGASILEGHVGKTEVTYKVMLDTGTSEKTTFFLPVPIDESTGEVADVMNELKVVDGTANWKIVDTAHGKALEVRTNEKCVLSAEKEGGYKGWEEGDEWLYSYNVSMFQGINKTNRAGYEVWVFASTANATVRIKLSLDDGINNVLGYVSVGSTPTDPFTYEIPLKEGWQTVKLSQRLMCYD